MRIAEIAFSGLNLTDGGKNTHTGEILPSIDNVIWRLRVPFTSLKFPLQNDNASPIRQGNLVNGEQARGTWRTLAKIVGSEHIHGLPFLGIGFTRNTLYGVASSVE
jgi:hypothetical protein